MSHSSSRAPLRRRGPGFGRMGNAMGILVSLAVHDLMSDKSVIREYAGRAMGYIKKKFLTDTPSGGALPEGREGKVYDAEITDARDHR